jgi:hypothetical protein
VCHKWHTWKVQVIRSPEFELWLEAASAKIQASVESRVFRIEHYTTSAMQSILEMG